MKNVAIFLVEDFEPAEAVTVIDILSRGGINLTVLSLTGEIVVNSSNHISLICDKVFIKNYLSDDNITYAYDFSDFDCVVLPGGKGTPNYFEDKVFLSGLKKFYDDGNLVCAICQAPVVLQEIGILEEKEVTCYPTFKDKLKGCNYSEKSVVVDGNIITSRSLGTALEFSLTILKVLMGTDVYNEVLASIEMNN